MAVVFDRRRFRVVERGEKVVQFDLEEVRSGDGGEEGAGGTEEDKARWRRAGTRETKNIGLIVGLEFVGRGGKGLIVGTTHL